jgi:hypothetical protein
MQNQQPMGTAPGGHVHAAASTRAGFLSRFSLWEKLKIGGLLVFAGVGGIFALVMFYKIQQNAVLFENSLDKAGDLSLNGKSYGSLGPHQHLRLELDPESYALTFSADGTKLDEGTLVVPKLKGGLGNVGYRAVYNIGGQKGLGVVTKFYGGGLKDTVVPIESGKRLVEVPPNADLAKVDEAFPKSITVPKGAMFGTVVRLCHIDEEKEAVGCPGW